MCKIKKLTKDNIIDFAEDHLLGHCYTTFFDSSIKPYGFETLSDLPLNLLEVVDEITFNCVRCGWWCETGSGEHIDGEDYCDNCSQEIRDEEEEEEY